MVHRGVSTAWKGLRVRCSRHAPGETVEPVAGVHDGAVLAACAGHLCGWACYNTQGHLHCPLLRLYACRERV
jgi:hypothetical protein